MSQFIFKAKKPSGETYEGKRDAADHFELYKLIKESGDEIIEYKEKAQSKGLHLNINISFLSRVKTIEKINFARNLGAMLEAGLALSRALSVLYRQSKNKALRSVLEDVMAEIDKGTTFADSLGKHPKVFPPIFVAMVHAGEQSGTLAASLKVIATQMDATFTLQRRIRGALMYPAVILTVMCIIGVLMFMFVVPTLLKTFTDLHVQLPLTTQIVLVISNIIQHQGLFVLAGFIGIIIGLIWMSKKPWGKNILHSVLLKLPVIGTLAQEVNTAHTARTLSSLMSSGVDVVEAVSITGTVVQNVHFQEVLKKAENAIKKGDLMSKVFATYGKLYPAFFVEMMSVGEETGKTGEMLIGVAHYYEEDVDAKTKDMSTIIEPVLIVFIGAAVGFFAVSMIQPMYSLVNAI